MTLFSSPFVVVRLVKTPSAAANFSSYGQKPLQRYAFDAYQNEHHRPAGQPPSPPTGAGGMICSCIQTKSSSLEGLNDREYGKAKQLESQVKYTKRWLSSKWTDWETFLAPFASKMLLSLSRKGELILVIDGSQTAGDCVTLMLSVLWQGYAIPLAWLVRVGKKGHFPRPCTLIWWPV